MSEGEIDSLRTLLSEMEGAWGFGRRERGGGWEGEEGEGGEGGRDVGVGFVGRSFVARRRAWRIRARRIPIASWRGEMGGREEKERRGERRVLCLAVYAVAFVIIL